VLNQRRPRIAEFSEIYRNVKSLLVRDGTLDSLYPPPRIRRVGLPLELSAWKQLMRGMNSSELEQLIKNFLEAKFGVALDYFVIEGRMAPDANGNMGVTGNYRKRTGDKNVFFTVTVNVTSRKIQNLQEY
jgi:hypothetical protein